MTITAANSAADVRGQAPAVIPVDDGVRYLNDPTRALPPLANLPAEGYDPFPAHGPARPSRFSSSYTLRPFDKWAADHLTGSHGVIARQASGFPVGTLIPDEGALRVVYRPMPDAWDSGYYYGGE